METVEERRRRRLIELIDLEGGPTRSEGRRPGHYVIASRVLEHEGGGGDSSQMAQALRQVARGLKNLGTATVNRIESAYQAARVHDVSKGWFDEGSAPPQDPTQPAYTMSGPRSHADIMSSLRLELPAHLARFLERQTNFVHSYDRSTMDYYSSELAMLFVAWPDPPPRDGLGEVFSRTYPAAALRSILKLAAWRADNDDHRSPLPRCIVGVICGERGAASAPVDVYHYAYSVRVELLHFPSVAEMAKNIAHWEASARDSPSDQ